MSQFVIVNNFSTTLAAALTASDTTISLSSSTNLPTLTPGQILPVTLNDAATGKIYEVCYVTAISGTSLTVVRGQEGTTATSWAVGDYIFSCATAAFDNDVTRIVPTVADLQAYQGASGRPVYLQGYSSTGDGGEGWWYWDPSSNATATTGTIIAVSGVATGRWVRMLDRAEVSVKWFGATGDGSTDDGAAIQAAIDAMSALGGGVVYFPKGTYYKPASSAAIIPKSNITLKGAGRGVTIMSFSDVTGSNRYLGTGSVTDTCSNFAVQDMTFVGAWSSTNYTTGVQIIETWYVTGLTWRNVEVHLSRGMGIGGRYCDDVTVENCYIHETNHDGIFFWESGNVRIVNNNLENVDDDGISLHTLDADAPPLRQNLVVANNTITCCQGIKVLGAKTLSITGNTMRRMRGDAIYIGADSSYSQGDTPVVGIRVEDNVIQDVMQRAWGGNGYAWYMWIGGSPQQAGTGAAAPGLPNPSTGAVVPLFGSNGVGNFQVNNVTTSSVASPGGYFISVKNNTMVRTLPAVAAVSDWGFGSIFPGPYNSGAYYTGAISEAQLNNDGMRIAPAINGLLVEGNTIAGTGNNGIMYQTGTTASNYDFRNNVIRDNIIRDFLNYGIYWQAGSSVTIQDIRIEGNQIDGDPRFINPNRGSNGTWQADTTPTAFQMPYAGNLRITGNDVRDVAHIVNIPPAHNFQWGNFFRCEPSAHGFSTSNAGVGHVMQPGFNWWAIIEDSNPTSSTYGQIISQSSISYNMMPSSGSWIFGQIVFSDGFTVTGPSGSQYVTLGWVRLTTGSTNVLNTDWVALQVPTGT